MSVHITSRHAMPLSHGAQDLSGVGTWVLHFGLQLLFGSLGAYSPPGHKTISSVQYNGSLVGIGVIEGDILGLEVAIHQPPSGSAI
ncbi:MAG: hypothetical protein M3P33_00930 [bacterium]|nr:hypothetical protein [bacterium]